MQKDKLQYNGKEVVYYKSALGKAKCNLLLMHGYSFNSKVWEDIGLVNALNGICNVFALDVPGFPRSINTFSISDEEFEELLHEIISRVIKSKVVLLGSSASGYLAMKFAEKYEADLKALILVGAVRLSEEAFRNISVKILGIWGSNDKTSDPKAGAAILRSSRNAEIKVIEGAGHACYLDKPKEFNNIIMKFLKGVA